MKKIESQIQVVSYTAIRYLVIWIVLILIISLLGSLDVHLLIPLLRKEHLWFHVLWTGLICAFVGLNLHQVSFLVWKSFVYAPCLVRDALGERKLWEKKFWACLTVSITAIFSGLLVILLAIFLMSLMHVGARELIHLWIEKLGGSI